MAMKRKFLVLAGILFCLLITIFTFSGKWIISGQVVDAVTGQPIEKAAVYIDWWKTSGRLIGFMVAKKIDAVECFTDEDGRFEVPRYSMFSDYRIMVNDYEMTIYKKGYVCWNYETVFPTYEKRKDFRLKNGMIIKMERFKDEYSKKKHAYFVTNYSLHRKSGGLFDKVIKSEDKIIDEVFESIRDKERLELLKNKRGK